MSAGPADGPNGPNGPETLLRVIAGEPTDEELAALVAVLAATAGNGPAANPSSVTQHWARPAHVRRAKPRSWAESRLPR